MTSFMDGPEGRRRGVGVRPRRERQRRQSRIRGRGDALRNRARIQGRNPMEIAGYFRMARRKLQSVISFIRSKVKLYKHRTGLEPPWDRSHRFKLFCQANIRINLPLNWDPGSPWSAGSTRSSTTRGASWSRGTTSPSPTRPTENCSRRGKSSTRTGSRTLHRGCFPSTRGTFYGHHTPSEIDSLIYQNCTQTKGREGRGIAAEASLREGESDPPEG